MRGAAEFLDAARPLLLADEPRQNLIPGLAGTLRDDPALYPEKRLWLVQSGDEVVVVGALPEVKTFSAAWVERTGMTPRLVHRQGIYVLERVGRRPACRGRCGRRRRTTARCCSTGSARSRTKPSTKIRDEKRVVRGAGDRLTSERAGFVLWDDGGRVSLAGFGGRTPNGIRIGPVFTPPELRGRGYASALVAGLSSDLLSHGRRFCFLYSDLANPTANRIYERIGYERVCESAEICFEALA